MYSNITKIKKYLYSNAKLRAFGIRKVQRFVSATSFCAAYKHNNSPVTPIGYSKTKKLYLKTKYTYEY